jgi:hypothetical protein
MNRLSEIDNQISESIVELNSIIHDFDFEIIHTFTLSQDIDFSFLSKLEYSGIYLIEIKVKEEFVNLDSWINHFTCLWHDENYKKHFVPNVKIKRVKRHTSLCDWFPIYIGKSKNISTRIKEHIDLKLSRPTTSMKLLERKNIYGFEFRIKTIVIPQSVKNYDVIAPFMESHFRNKISPILGRQ